MPEVNTSAGHGARSIGRRKIGRRQLGDGKLGDYVKTEDRAKDPEIGRRPGKLGEGA